MVGNGRGLSARRVNDVLESCTIETASPFGVGYAGIWPIPHSIGVSYGRRHRGSRSHEWSRRTIKVLELSQNKGNVPLILSYQHNHGTTHPLPGVYGPTMTSQAD